MLKKVKSTVFVLFIAAAAVSQPLSAAQVVKEELVDWSSFKYPEVIIVDKDNGSTEGSKLVKKMIPDLEQFIKDISLGVCKTLYKSPDEVPSFETLIFELEATDGVAYKMGNNPRIKIHMSTKYLEGQYKRMGDEAITYEIAGINWHELTHAYQHSPRAAGSDRFGAVESMADAVRITAGYHKTRKPRPGGNWNDGYTTGGFFIEWIQNKYDKEFVYKFNQSCKDIRPWSWDKACNKIVGKDVQALWNEYQWHLKGGGSEAVAEFAVSRNIVGLGQEVKLVNNSFNEPVSYQWSFPGATPSVSTDAAPVIKYSQPGQYDITLTAVNKEGKTTKTEKACVMVIKDAGGINSFAEIKAGISCEPDVAMPREGIENLVDNNSDTKYCAQIRSSKITYALTKPAKLLVYSITSANDAPGRDPGKWTISGSNDKENWETVDTQQGITFSDRNQRKQFLVKDNTKKYSFYRFDMETKRDPIFQIAEIELQGSF